MGFGLVGGSAQGGDGDRAFQRPCRQAQFEGWRVGAGLPKAPFMVEEDCFSRLAGGGVDGGGAVL
jgi:hypothetical protein